MQDLDFTSPAIRKATSELTAQGYIKRADGGKQGRIALYESTSTLERLDKDVSTP
jgi:hypothetical protein